MDDYAFSTDIDVQLRDIDRLHHVNNAVVVTYLQQARIEYFDHLVGYVNEDIDVVVATQTMEYRHPIEWGDTVTVDLRVTDIGSSSLTVEYRVRVGETVCATAETVLVTFDRSEQESVSLPDDWREALRADNEPFLE
jgi:acyl-CoA thioester hydrolase